MGVLWGLWALLGASSGVLGRSSGALGVLGRCWGVSGGRVLGTSWRPTPTKSEGDPSFETLLGPSWLQFWKILGFLLG